MIHILVYMDIWICIVMSTRSSPSHTELYPVTVRHAVVIICYVSDLLLLIVWLQLQHFLLIYEFITVQHCFHCCWGKSHEILSVCVLNTVTQPLNYWRLCCQFLMKMESFFAPIKCLHIHNTPCKSAVSWVNHVATNDNSVAEPVFA
jgi:hypothetical protein